MSSDVVEESEMSRFLRQAGGGLTANWRDGTQDCTVATVTVELMVSVAVFKKGLLPLLFQKNLASGRNLPPTLLLDW